MVHDNVSDVRIEQIAISNNPLRILGQQVDHPNTTGRGNHSVGADFKHAPQDALLVFLTHFMAGRHLGRDFVHWPAARVDKQLISFGQARLEPSLLHAD